MSEENHIHDSQEAALRQAFSILSEHFDSFLLAYDTEVTDGTDHCFSICYKGGGTLAVGLAERAKITILHGSPSEGPTAL